MNRAQFGELRQEIWASLHFPFHLALVLLVEGASQFILWRKVVEVVSYVSPENFYFLSNFYQHQGDQPTIFDRLKTVRRCRSD